jgi:hypothetical protein
MGAVGGIRARTPAVATGCVLWALLGNGHCTDVRPAGGVRAAVMG